jgi:predicted transcriptional regulator
MSPEEELRLFSDDRLVLQSALMNNARDTVRRVSESVNETRDTVRRTQELIEQSWIMLRELDSHGVNGRRML